jgi:bacterioferritin
MDMYLLQGRMLDDWGYNKLKERLVHESLDERGHADKIIGRILFLEGEPDMSKRLNLGVGKNPKEMFENDLKYELDVSKGLNEAITLCTSLGDNGTRAMLEELLTDTESDHIFWLQSQLKLIEDVGLAQYLAEQM